MRANGGNNLVVEIGDEFGCFFFYAVYDVRHVTIETRRSFFYFAVKIRHNGHHERNHGQKGALRALAYLIIMVGAETVVNAGESVQILDGADVKKRGTISTMQFRMNRGVACGVLSLAAVLLLEAGCTMFKEKPASTFAEATGGEGLERVFWKNLAAANWTEVDRAMAGNYAGVSANGALDKATALEQYRKWQLKDFSIGDLKTEMNGNTIVVTYTVTLSGTAGSQPLPTEAQRMMSVWQQQKSGWVEIAHSSNMP